MFPIHSSEKIAQFINQLEGIDLSKQRIIIENTTQGILKTPSYTLGIGQKDWRIVTWFKRLFGVNKRVATLAEIMIFFKWNESYLSSAHGETIRKLSPIFTKNHPLKESFEALITSLKNSEPKQPVAPLVLLDIPPSDELDNPKVEELGKEITFDDLTSDKLSEIVEELVTIPQSFKEFLTSYTSHCDAILRQDTNNLHFTKSMQLITAIQPLLEIILKRLEDIKSSNSPCQNLVNLITLFKSNEFYSFFKLILELTTHEETCLNSTCMVELENLNQMNLFELTRNKESPYLALTPFVQIPTRISLIMKTIASALAPSLESQQNSDITGYAKAFELIGKNLNKELSKVNESMKISKKLCVDSQFKNFKSHLLVADHIFIDTLPDLKLGGTSIRKQNLTMAIQILNSHIQQVEHLHQELADLMTKQNTAILNQSKRTFLEIEQDIQESERILEKYLSYLNNTTRPKIKKDIQSQLPKAYRSLITFG